MPAALTIRDETAAGRMLNELTLEFPSETISARELIRSRVYQEVQDYNAKRPEIFRGLIRPSEAEEALNGCKPATAREIDWRRQVETAITAFRKGLFVILVGDRQVESLDQDIRLSAETQVTFLKLLPLVGG